MSNGGQRIDLRFGGVSVEVALSKTSGKSAEAKHTVRRMIGDELADVARMNALHKWQREHGSAEVREERVAANGALGEYVEQHAAASLVMDDETQERFNEAVAEVNPYADLPPERIEHGVYRPVNGEPQAVQDFTEDGEWVDLTDRLAKIDERTRIDGMEVVATIPSPSVPRHRVRDSYWIGLAPDAAGTPKVLALLWAALRKQQRAAVVKWTKRTNQALGIIVASGAVPTNDPALVLLEIEWSANMRKPGPRATAPLTVETSIAEQAAALALVEALAEPSAFLDSVRDERTAKRAELLEAARAGTLEAFEPPPEPVSADSDLSAVLGARS
jgi:non-homologous end joining protein Ku